MKIEEIVYDAELACCEVLALVERLHEENVELKAALKAITSAAAKIDLSEPETSPATEPEHDREAELVEEIAAFKDARQPRERISEEFRDALCELRALGWSLPKIKKLSGVSQGILSPLFKEKEISPAQPHVPHMAMTTIKREEVLA